MLQRAVLWVDIYIFHFKYLALVTSTTWSCLAVISLHERFFVLKTNALT